MLWSHRICILCAKQDMLGSFKRNILYIKTEQFSITTNPDWLGKCLSDEQWFISTTKNLVPINIPCHFSRKSGFKGIYGTLTTPANKRLIKKTESETLLDHFALLNPEEYQVTKFVQYISNEPRPSSLLLQSGLYLILLPVCKSTVRLLLYSRDYLFRPIGSYENLHMIPHGL